MRCDAREWSFPEPFRALVWWPAVSFVVAILAPEAAVWAIIVAGFSLASVGALVPAVGRRLHRRVEAAEPSVTEISQVETAF